MNEITCNKLCYFYSFVRLLFTNNIKCSSVWRVDYTGVNTWHKTIYPNFTKKIRTTVSYSLSPTCTELSPVRPLIKLKQLTIDIVPLYILLKVLCLLIPHILRFFHISTRQFWENCNSPDLHMVLLILWNMFSLSPLRHGKSRRCVYAALSDSINQHGDQKNWPWHLTFWTLNRFTGYHCDVLPSCQFWVS